MRVLLEKLFYFKDIHPIRFWALVSGVLIIIALFLVLRKLFLNHKSAEKLRVGNVLRKQNRFLSHKKIYLFLLTGLIAGGILIGYFFIPKVKMENLWISNSGYVFGIDISHYQGRINWPEVRNSKHPIEFIIIRATMGNDGKDSEFEYNWMKAKEKGYMRGAYHYYRPNENSSTQFKNYEASVDLKSGDFKPILDIEMPSKFGKENLRAGVQNWLRLAEEKYGVKPIVYTGRHFYNEQLKGYIDDYPLWIASYSNEYRLSGIEWTFHQFTEQVIVKGIPTSVDGNNFKRELIDLKGLCLQ